MTKEKRSFFERLTGLKSNKELPEEKNTPKRIVLKTEDNIAEEFEEEVGELAVDMYETPDHIIIKTMTAGVKPDELDISITRDMVIIKGKREETREVSDESYYHKELYWGTFSRSILLPQEIEVEGAEATEKHGLLTIRLPKLDKNRETKLKVKSF
jgi:HSP20 family protein